MTRYKYLPERPVVNLATAEKMMDFGPVLSRTLKKRRFRLIRNTVLITVIVSVSLMTVFYFTQMKNDSQDTLQQPGQSLSVDSNRMDIELNLNTVPEREINNRKIGSQESGEPNSEKSPENYIESREENHGKDQQDHFKIRESFSNDQVIKQAEPVTGLDSLYAYFNKNLQYPQGLIKEKIEGRVVVQFVVTRYGKVEDVKIIQSLHPVLDSIARASVMNMPSWIPASVNGTDIDSKHSIPLTFNIETR